MSTAGYRPWGRSQDKIGPEHRDRTAVVYVRQSSRQQVLEHTESARLQYALVERAAALGWARSRIVVIDDDLGMSAAMAGAREGFARLVTEVTMGRVGIVLGIEMSRLARTGRDWHQLLELCSLSGALLADPDGVYDPREYNDRLLLGLKGTMSEAELYLIRQRMMSGRLAKAERGELALPLPIGYVRRPSGQVVLDPDEQARHVVELIFSTFDRLGTLNAVLRYLVEHQIQLPVRASGGPAKGELEWRRPTRETLQNMLHNPIYAGYYAYGRRRVDPRRKQPGRPSTGRVVRDSDEWWVLLPDRMPAYITVEQYQANIAKMAANRQIAASPGAARDGSALLAGLLRCGLCGGGHRMTVRYHTPAGRNLAHGYVCAYNQVNFGTGGPCQHIAGPALDAYVTGQVLAALSPAALEVSLLAVEQAHSERATLDRLWRQRLERARYAADRARRQYQLAEPENRLVVRQLETDWEAALAEIDRLQADYQHFTDACPVTLTAGQRHRIQLLAGDVPEIWHAPTTTVVDRKELLRTVIDKITVSVVGDSELVDVTITWAGGHQTTGQAVRPVSRLDQLSYYPQLLSRVIEFAEQGHTPRQIADRLNAEGFRPPKRTSRFGPGQVRTLLNRHNLIARQRRVRPEALSGLGPDQWSVTTLAAALNMPTATIYNWIYRGWVTARPSSDDRHWIITADAAEMQRLRQRRDRPPGFYTRARWAKPLDNPPTNDGAER
ncbi:recombinase family protein [Microbispora bryophytorum]|uniref:recombinase family protein n=1 Tax=Microbispora bryophytorum TaxID=1460882 RepID=UPI0033E5F018